MSENRNSISKEELQTISIPNLNQRRSSLKWVENLKRNSKNINSSIISNDITFNPKKELNIEEMISNAKIHREANRPLIKIKIFDGQTKFCKCCYLPSNDNIYLKTFSFCENTDKFASCGRGTSLYFLYYRFSALILFFALILMALPSFILTNNFTNQLIDICYKIYQIEKENINITFPECRDFINLNGISEIFIKDTDWEFKYNAINIKEYRNIYYKTTKSYNNVDKILINYNLEYFIGLITLFIINLLFIIMLYNFNKQYDISVTSPSDYTIIISNLYSAFDIFWKKINKINQHIANNNINNDKSKNNMDIEIININENIKNNNDNNSKYEIKEINEIKEIEELGLEGFPQDKEINIIDAFYTFIKNKICESSKGEKFNVHQINICYKISEFMKIEEEIQKLNSEIYKINRHPKQKEKNKNLELKDKNRKYFYYPLDILGLNIFTCELCEKYHILSEIEEEKNKLEIKLKELIKDTDNLTKNNFSGVIFVTFNNIKETEKFIEPYPKNIIMKLFVSFKNLKYFLCFCFVDKKKRKRFLLKRNISVDIAPEPEDVIFENLQYSSLERFFRTLLTYIISLIIIFVCFIIILALNYLQIKQKKSGSENKRIFKYTVSLIITLVISALNSVFLKLLDFLTKKEKQISMTNYYLSYSVKLTLFTFTTSGIIPLISCQYFNSQSNYDLLVTNMLTLFLSNSFLTPIMWTMNFEFFYKKLKICLVEKKRESYTQRELNQIYELLDMGIASKYSYIAKTLLMSFFYMPIFPLSIFISLLGFIFGYFLEKFNFSNMYKRPEMLNSKICEFYSNYFILNFFMLCVGDYIFLEGTNKSNFWSLFNIIFFGVLIIIPYNQIFAFDFIGINESELKVNQTYEDYYFNFYNDYERINPITKKEGIKHFFHKLNENGLISKQDYDLILQNFENINLMETYYKARKHFNNSLIQRAFLGLIKNRKDNTNTRKSTFIETFKDFIKKNGDKALNILLFLGNPDKKESNENGNNIYIYKENSNNKDTNCSNNRVHLNDSRNNNMNNIDIYKKNNNSTLEQSERKSLRKYSQKLFENFILKEQNKILNLYNNPLFFGIRVLCQSLFLNKNEEFEEIEEEKNNIENLENIAEEKKENILSENKIEENNKIEKNEENQNEENNKNHQNEEVINIEKNKKRKNKKKKSNKSNKNIINKGE